MTEELLFPSLCAFAALRPGVRTSGRALPTIVAHQARRWDDAAMRRNADIAPIATHRPAPIVGATLVVARSEGIASIVGIAGIAGRRGTHAGASTPPTGNTCPRQ